MKRSTARWFMAVLASALIAGCGGGSGGGTTANHDQNQNQAANKLSGIVAAGAPIIGQAYLKDSSNPANTLGPTEIAADGGFSFDVTSLTAPFYLQAEGTVGGQGYTLHSVAMPGATTANINPLTNLAVAAAAGVNDPAAVYNDPATNVITSDALATAIADMMATLQPLLDAYGISEDFLTGSFTADHTGLDGMLDVVEVEIDTTTGAVTINDIITNTTIAAMTTTTVASPTDTISSTEATGSVTAVTDIQGIATFLSNLATALNKGPNLQVSDVEPYVATNFGINNGLDRTTFIEEMTSNNDVANAISSISGVSIQQKMVNGDYVINAVVHMSNGSIDSIDELVVTNEGGAWKIKGNGYKSDIGVEFSAQKYVYSDGTASVRSGLRVDVEDNGSQGLQSAVITGPGLPSEGYTLAKGTTDAVDMEPSGWSDAPFYHIYPISDATIETISATDLTYTVIIKDAQGATVETRTVTLPKRPYKVSELTPSYYPQVSGISTLNTSSLNLGGTLTFTYAKPTAYQVSELGGEVGYWNTTGTWDATDKDLPLTGTSANIVTLAPQGTVQGGWLRMDASDVYGREVVVQWEFRPTSNTAFPGNTDNQVPTAPSGLTATAISSSRIDLSWTASTDNVGVTLYRIYRGTTLVGTSTTTTYSDTGLTASTAYSYTVKALDAVGNVSSASNTATATTASGTTTTTNPLVGSWYFQTGEFNAGEPGNITFRENGYYTVYADCSKQVEPVPNVDLEIGTYTYADGLLTITSHIQNGCGGFDHEEDATIPPDSPLNVTFNSDGSSMTLTLYGVTLAKVQDTASPIVGGWEIGTFDASDAHTVTFYKNGYYTVYADCSNQVEPLNLEIGTYTYADGLLTITSHIQNGCGGFDDESGTGIPPVDPLSISFSADKSAMTIVNYNLTFTRIE